MAKNYRVSLAKILKDKDESVRQAAADALNAASDKLKRDMVQNMATVGLISRSGNLAKSIDFKPATAKRPRVTIISDAVKNAPDVSRQGVRNPAMRGRYLNDKAAYGRYIEFSERIHKPFFYTAWYEDRQKVTRDIIEAIGKAWTK